MNNRVSQQLRADYKRLLREPILIVLFLVPFLALTATKLILFYGLPILRGTTGFDLAPFYGYVLSMSLLLAPGMLGAVSGFMMIDDRDERITDLMSVTPMGYEGYIKNRLLIPFVLSILYTFSGYHILNIYQIDIQKLLFISVLTGIQAMTVGLFLFLYSDNKVKGLTYAKGLNGLMITVLADLAKIPWLSAICACLPFYWIAQIILKPLSLIITLIAVLIHAIWLFIPLYKACKS